MNTTLRPCADLNSQMPEFIADKLCFLFIKRSYTKYGINFVKTLDHTIQVTKAFNYIHNNDIHINENRGSSTELPLVNTIPTS